MRPTPPAEDLLRRADRTPLLRASVVSLAACLPSNADVVLQAVALAADRRARHAFMVLLVAALEHGIDVDARWLPAALELAANPAYLAAPAFHCSGDVAAAALDAFTNPRVPDENRATSLLLGALWASQHRPEHVPRIFARAAIMALRPLGASTRVIILALAQLAVPPDEGLIRAVMPVPDPYWPQMAEQYARALAAATLVSPAGVLPVVPPPASRPPSRKFVPSSGKRRRRAPEPVASLPKEYGPPQVAPRADDVEIHLTEAELRSMEPVVLRRLDVRRIPSELRDLFLGLLLRYWVVDAALLAFERLGWTPERDPVLVEAANLAAERGERETVRRFLALRKPATPQPYEPGPAALLMALDHGDCPAAAAIEAAARRALDGDDYNYARSMLSSDCPALGVLLARGPLLTAKSDEDVRYLRDLVARARSRIGAPAADPADPFLDERRRRDEDASPNVDTEGAARAKALFDELAAVRRELAEARAEADAERARADLEAARTAPERARDERTRRLQQQLDEAEERVDALMAERREARRLEKQRAAEERDAAVGVAAPEPTDDDDGLSTPEPPADEYPVRALHIDPAVADAIAAFPRRVAEAAFVTIGQLAAGRRSAFVGCTRLTERPGYFRQKVGRDYRLLFALDRTTLRVVDLVDRKDFAARVRALPRGPSMTG